MSALLIAEPPLQVLRSLACQVGINEAILAQQVWWRGRNRDGAWTARRTMAEWNADFPWMGERTLERAFAKLQTAGWIEKHGQSEWRIAPGRQPGGESAILAEPAPDLADANRQDGGPPRVSREEEEKQKGKKKRAGSRIIPTEEEPIGFSEWLGYHHEVTGRSVPRAGTQTRSDLARLFAALVAQGYELCDFKAVTDYGHLDAYWADKDLTLDWHLRLGAFGERVESGRRLRERETALAPASVDAVDWSRFDG